MIYVSEPKTTPPESFRTPLQKQAYQALAKLEIPFRRVDNDEALTMEDCRAIDEMLDMQTVKTLLLCNRQQTEFYLFVTPGDKPFSAKSFGAAMGVSRVSFAPAARLEELLGVVVGAATVFGCLKDAENRVRLVLDRDILSSEWFGCSDGTTTGYIKLKTEDVLEKFLPYSKHTPTIADVLAKD